MILYYSFRSLRIVYKRAQRITLHNGGLVDNGGLTKVHNTISNNNVSA